MPNVQDWISNGGGCNIPCFVCHLTPRGIVNLLEQVEILWNQGAESRAARWADELRDARSALLSARQKFYEWYPLKLYISHSAATSSRINFSLRYLGQQVATLEVKTNGVVYIYISERQRQRITASAVTLCPVSTLEGL